MNRGEMLDRCKEIVTKHRQTEHGTPEDSFKRIAAFWSAYLGREVTSCDVARMMILLKIARSMANNKNDDNYLDMAGYAACGVEIATTPTEPEKVWHYSHLGKRLCGNDEPNSSGTEIANRVTCLTCLEKMLEIMKVSMGFGPGTPSESQIQDLKRVVGISKETTFKENQTDPLMPVQEKMEPCCACGEVYPRSELIEGRHIYCAKCRLIYDENTGKRIKPALTEETK